MPIVRMIVAEIISNRLLSDNSLYYSIRFDICQEPF